MYHQKDPLVSSRHHLCSGHSLAQAPKQSGGDCADQLVSEELVWQRGRYQTGVVDAMYISVTVHDEFDASDGREVGAQLYASLGESETVYVDWDGAEDW